MSRNRVIVLSVLAGIIIARSLLAIWWFYSRADGFFMLFGDSCERTLMGYWWLKSGLSRGCLTWLPLHFFILALIFEVVPDLVNVPPMLGTACYAGVIVWIYRISRRLFDVREKETVALFAASIAAFYYWPFHRFGPSGPNWLFGLSLSGMVEPLFHFFLLGGIAFFTDYVYSNRLRYLFPAAILIGLSSALRYEGWLFAAVLSVYLAARFIRSFKEKRQWSLLACAALMDAFVPYWVLDSYFRCGGYIEKTLMWGERQSGLLKSLFFYPQVLFRTDFIVLLLAVIGTGLAFINRPNRKTVSVFLFLPAIYLLSLILLSVFFGPIGFISRPLALVFLMLIPFAAYAFFKMFRTALGAAPTRLLLIVSALFIVFMDVKSLYTCRSYGYVAPETIEIGKKIKKMYSAGPAPSGEKILLELKPGPNGMVWDFMALRLFAPDTVLLDRDDLFDKSSRLITQDNPSVFERNEGEFMEYCRDNGVKSLILTSDKYILKANKYARQAAENGEYRLFILDTENR